MQFRAVYLKGIVPVGANGAARTMKRERVIRNFPAVTGNHARVFAQRMARDQMWELTSVRQIGA